MAKQDRVCITHLDITGTKVIKFYDEGHWKLLIKLDSPLYTQTGIMIEFITTRQEYVRGIK